MKNAHLLLGFCALLCLPLECNSADNVVVESPNGKVRFNTLLDDPDQLRYQITLAENTVIEQSSMGVTIDGVDLGRGFEAGDMESYSLSESYPWFGVHSPGTNRCNGVRLPLKHAKTGIAFTVEIRAFDDGIAFRYIVPGESRRVPDEATVFRLPAGSTLWIHDFEDHYEAHHARKSLRSVAPGAWAAPPLTFRLPDGAGYASITEGALRNYSGMGLQGDGEGAFHARLGHAIPASYPFRLRYEDQVEAMSRPAAIEGTITTPWRVVMVGADLNALVNCDIVHSVADPPDARLFPNGIHTDWVKPGRSVWSYLDGGTRTLEGMKHFSRLASDLGFEYNLLEGFWSRWPESDLKELVDYSRGLGVRIIIWRHSRELRTEKSLREFFEMCNRTGVAGAKIDFFDHEHKDIVDLYETILKMAAEHHLVIDFHGANKPTGLERTYPNLLGLEGIRGLEMRPPYAQHDATLPFTRMLAGLADYTPVHFGQRRGDTTWAHQVANAILLPAPLLVYGAHPANILANPTADMLKSIPSVWDETVVLPASDIGMVAALARRKGDTWFVAVANGVYERTIRVDLSFLGEGSCQSLLIRDGDEAASVQIEHLTLRRSDSLYVKMPSGGGFVGRFTR
jgi:alpha-glucosidase